MLALPLTYVFNLLASLSLISSTLGVVGYIFSTPLGGKHFCLPSSDFVYDIHNVAYHERMGSCAYHAGRSS